MTDQIKLKSNRVIYINGRFLTQPVTGVQRYAMEILTAWDQLLEAEPPSAQIICLVPPRTDYATFPGWRRIKVQVVGRFKGNLWEQIDLPYHARRGLLLNLCNIGPVLHRNQVVVFHDASVFAVPKAYSWQFKLKYRLVMRVLAHSARQIITDSEFSRSELAHYLRIDPGRIQVVYPGCDHLNRIEQDSTIMHNAGLTDRPYWLTVGSMSPHKNVGAVVKMVKENPYLAITLVIVGGKYHKVFNQIQEFDDPRIIQLGYVNDAQLKALYMHAEGFIFPSLYEGFGIPPLEAMSCGCPVISSNRASLPEVCGDAAILVEPINRVEFFESITLLKSDIPFTQSLIGKGINRSREFSWGKSVLLLNLISQKHSLR